MKKIVCILLGISFLMGFSACEDKDDAVPLNPNVAFIVELDANGWTRESNSLIRFDIPLQDLSDYYMDQGGVSVALSFDNEGSYDILPATFEGVSYSINYTTGWITVYAADPLADDSITIDFPNGNIVAKIILTETDYLDYQGVFNDPASDKMFTPLNLK